MSNAATAAVDALRRVTSSFTGAEERQGQVDMATAIAQCLVKGKSIVVQAGTGTGKSLGYLVPAILNGKTVVVATATKALQDQLAQSDLPLLKEHLGVDFSWAVVKGRSNYVCRQRIKELTAKDTSQQLEFEEMTDMVKREVSALCEWAAITQSGDIEELPKLPSDKARRAITVGVDECPGRSRCPSGEQCFAEAARDAAKAADVVVVNFALYGLHVASGGAILPDHEVVIFDEAHQLEDTMSRQVGAELSAGRFSSLASSVRRVLEDPDLTRRIDDAGLRLSGILGPMVDQRLTLPLPEGIQHVLSSARLEINEILAALRAIDSQNEDVKQKSLRAQTQSSRLAEDIDTALGTLDGYVVYVAGTPERPSLQVSPLHVGEVLLQTVWSQRPAVLTSATIPNNLPDRVGLPMESVEVLSVASPFDYERNSLLYCSPHFPDRNSPEFADFVHDELEALITAAGGRTLALFTSNKALNAAVQELRNRVDFPILAANEFGRQATIDKFLADEHACLFASQGFFQGVDFPGSTLSLVVIDKIPFPTPSDPLLQARREAIGREKAFSQIDLPIAATALAQAAGRLIRTASDRGVVAILDQRLATANYKWELIRTLPPMSRSRDREAVEQFLRDITNTSK